MRPRLGPSQRPDTRRKCLLPRSLAHLLALLLPIVALDACSDVSRDASGSRAAGPRCAKLSSTAVEEEEIEVDVAHADTSDYLAIVVREGSGKADTLRDWVFDRPPVLTEDSSSILGEVESNPRWEGNSLPASIAR